jgi:hypothetical protein
VLWSSYSKIAAWVPDHFPWINDPVEIFGADKPSFKAASRSVMLWSNYHLVFLVFGLSLFLISYFSLVDIA